MTDKQIREVLENRGYIVSAEYHQHNIADVYNSAGAQVGRCHVGAMERFAQDPTFRTWCSYSDTKYLADHMSKKYQDFENLRHCKRIADELDEYAAGDVYICPECGEHFTMPDDVGDRFCCPCCHETRDTDDFEQCSMYDYFDDVYDVEYRCNSQKELRSVQIMVACGGPNIYIDTGSQKVELYWWTDRADWPLSSDAVEAVDDWAEEYWGCI